VTLEEDGGVSELRSEGDHPDIVLNALGYREDGEWVALALEMDLRGYGIDFSAALTDLRSLVEAQVSFAILKGQPELIWRPAKAANWQLFSRLREDRLCHLDQERRADEEFYVAGMPIPPPHVVQSLKSGWSGPSSTAS
jgi:hypothetical protein